MKTQTNNITTIKFNEPFIDRLVDIMDEEFVQTGADLHRVAVVFGGKRPALFAKRALAVKYQKSFYSPKFFTIDEFVSLVVKKKFLFKRIDELENAYLLYHLARQHTPRILKGRELFSQFLPWTKDILKFIENLDLENVSPDKLKNIQSNAAIGYDVPPSINELLESIGTLREVYHQELERQKCFTRGIQYLKAAQVIDDIKLSEFDAILFANLFYLNASEKKLVKSLYDRGQARLIFQGDERKWPVLKNLSRDLGSPIQEGERVEKQHFKLHLHKGFDAHSQIGTLREILKGIKNINQTVIVLPDAAHIIPLISEISSLVAEFNISMGYPLKRSSLYTLFTLIFKTQLSRKKERYYARDYLKVLQHPFVKNLRITGDSTVTRILIHKLEEILTGKEQGSITGSLFVELEDIESCDELYRLTLETLDRMKVATSRDELEKVLETIHEYVFIEWESLNSFGMFVKVLDQFLELMIQKSSMEHYPMNINIANKVQELLVEFRNVSFKDEPFTQIDIFKIFESRLSGEIVAFVGSPLKGLQILGLLETRSLNFENVIVLDVNEGILPRLNLYEALIPREVMVSLNLDRLEQEEEIQRYQFMRLISSAKNVHLIYQESKDKERSRFIEELIWEEQKSKNDIVRIPVVRANFKVEVSSHKKVYKKTPVMVEFLKGMRFSASSVNMYLRNPAEFYFNYVLGLREKDNLLDDPEARHIGTFIHEHLEHSFRPFLGQKPVLDEKFRQQFNRTLEERFAATFGKNMKSDAFLLKSIIQERLSRFLENEADHAERRVEKLLYLENKFEDVLELSCGRIKFGYVVDRVDKMRHGTVMIIDYKTGGLDMMPKPPEGLANLEFSRETIRDYVKSFQLPLYFHYLNRHYPHDPINAALYNLRTLKVDTFIVERNTMERDQICQAYLEALDFVMSEILNPNIDFVEDETAAY